MPVLTIAFAEVRDAEKFQTYVGAAAPLMAEHGAEVVVRGRYVQSMLTEDMNGHVVGVFRFENLASAKAFYCSHRYQQLVPLSEEAADMTFHFYEE